MDEKGDDAIGMDDEATEPEKTHEDVKSVDKKGDEVADMPAKQSNLGKRLRMISCQTDQQNGLHCKKGSQQ